MSREIDFLHILLFKKICLMSTCHLHEKSLFWTIFGSMSLFLINEQRWYVSKETVVLCHLGRGGGITRKFSFIYYKEFLKLIFWGLALYQSRDTLSTQWIKPYHIVPDKVNLPHCLCTCMGWPHLVIHRLILNHWNFVLQAWPEHHDPHLDQDKFTVKRRQTAHKTASFYKFTSPDWISEKSIL